MKNFLFSTLLFLIANLISSQDKGLSNSEYLVLEEKARGFINSNVDSSFSCANKIEKSNNSLHKAFAKGLKSYLYQIKGDTLKSNFHYNEAFSFLDKSVASNEKIRMHSILLNYGGLIDWKREKLNEALLKYKKARKLSEQVDDFKQILKIDRNSALIYSQVGNNKLAITILKNSNEILDSNEFKFTEEDFFSNKSTLFLNLGYAYYKTHADKKSEISVLDSALYYYQKTITFSKNLNNNKLSAQNNIATIYYLKKNYKEAEKIYFDILSYSKENNSIDTFYNTMFNLGELYYEMKQYEKSEACFQKVDSIYNKDALGELEYIKSNYYQAKLFDIKNDPEKALYHSTIYLAKREEFESKLNQNKADVNFDIESLMIKKDMDEIQDKYKNIWLFKRILYAFIVAVFLFLIGYLLKTIREKKLIDAKVQQLISEFRATSKENELLLDTKIEEITLKEQIVKSSQAINIDDVKEEEIVKKLLILEKKLFYLNPDFNLQTVAKKVKTNTTYLSYIVNKRFEKTFSEYSNELKINYIIQEIINNPTYRKYSTQALAESVGFKNAISFSKSFNKRTGVTPAQFIKRLD